MPSQEADDVTLLARAARGDRDAFDVIIGRHGGVVQRVARIITGEEALACDVAQQALWAAFRGTGGYKSELGSVRGWLLAITRNTARRALRPKPEQLMQAPLEDLLDLGVAAGWGRNDDPEVALGHAEEAERVVRAIATLPVDEREVLILRDIEGVAGEEVAAILALGLAAMKSRLHRARLHLMAYVRAGEGGVMAADRMAGTLRCTEVLAQLSDYVDGELETSAVEAIQEHLRGCTVCERFGGRFAATVGALRATLGAAPVVDEALVARLRASYLTRG